MKNNDQKNVTPRRLIATAAGALFLVLWFAALFLCFTA